MRLDWHAKTVTLIASECCGLALQDITSIVGTIWSSDCRGDQAYFFRRKSGVAAMPNGSIVSLVNGELMPDTASHQTVRPAIAVRLLPLVSCFLSLVS